MLSALLNHPWFDSYDLSACSAVLSGGDRAPPELVEETERRFGARFSILYGQTELSPAVTQTSPDESAHDKLHTAGRPLWQVEVKIVGPADVDPLPVGEPGLWPRTSHRATGTSPTPFLPTPWERGQISDGNPKPLP